MLRSRIRITVDRDISKFIVALPCRWLPTPRGLTRSTRGDLVAGDCP